MSRSHRHAVPTARPPAGALGIVYVWGRGRPGVDLRRYLKESGAAVDDRDDVARRLARSHGCPIDLVDDAWAWRLEHAETHDVDRTTRDDPAVMGWTANEHETCEPRIALRNLVGALSPAEVNENATAIAERFKSREHAP